MVGEIVLSRSWSGICWDKSVGVVDVDEAIMVIFGIE